MKKLTLMLVLAGCTSFASLAVTFVPAWSSPSAASPTICSSENVILGTAENDEIVGTDGPDIICGLGGDDAISGLGGDDIIIGGDGNDNVDSGPGDDSVDLGSGNDFAHGGQGNDTLSGGSGADSEIGDGGNDYVSGGPGADNLFGSDGLDTLLGDAGNDSLNGGQGADGLAGGSGDDTCQKDPLDTVSSCYFDRSAPVVSNVALAPADATIDSTDPSQTVRIRYTARDAGTGVQSVGLTFVDAYGLKQLSKGLAVEDLMLGPQRFGAHFVSCCGQSRLIEGTATLGVYESTLTMPRNLYKGRYYLAQIQARDGIGWVRTMGYKELASKKMAVSFNQTGINDLTPPTLESFEILGSRILSSTSSVVHAKAIVKDDTLATQNLALNTYNILSQVTYGLRGKPSSSWIYTSWRQISAHAADDYRVAIELELSFSYGETDPSVSPPNPYVLTGLILTDAAGNYRTVSNLLKYQLKSLIYKKFGNQSVTSLRSSPKIASLTVSPNSISTATGNQTIVIKITLTDAYRHLTDNVWISLRSREFANSDELPVWQFDCETTASGTGARKSYVGRCVIPAHYPPTNLDLTVNGWDWEQLKSMRLPWTVENK